MSYAEGGRLAHVLGGWQGLVGFSAGCPACVLLAANGCIAAWAGRFTTAWLALATLHQPFIIFFCLASLHRCVAMSWVRSSLIATLLTILFRNVTRVKKISLITLAATAICWLRV